MNVLSKLFRLSEAFISVNLAVVMTTGTSTGFAQTGLINRTGAAAVVPVSTTRDSPNLLTSLDPAKISFQEVAGGLTTPVFITNAGDGSGRLFVIEQPGFIRILKNGSLLGTPFLDIHSIIKSGGEQGLLALAFHPSYSTNGVFFVAYTAPRSGDATGSNLVLERFSVSANNPDLANPSSGVVLLTIGHPVNSNHNGGTLVFGGDGYLYWSTGDGGSGGDPPNNAQQLNNLLGKLLRIDVNSGSPYGIPTSNPFYSSVDPNVKKEIWAYGLRNPWRLSFDDLNHDLYIGDVGQSAREEVDFQLASSVGGENYGWRVMEGSICYNPSSGCDQNGKIKPVAEYDHTLGCAITGGYVYRGLNFPSLNGYYFYGDYCSGRFFSLIKDPVLGWKTVQLADTPYSISSFGEDEQGELYLADLGSGKIYNIRYQEPPFVKSSMLADSNPTGATNVNFMVTFSKPVTGVDKSDFSLITTGVSNAAVSGVSGSGSVYTVTVNTGCGDGTIRLDVSVSATITDLAANPLGGLPYTGGETYTVNKPPISWSCWYGGAVITADQNVLAVGQPHIGSEDASYDGFSSGSTTMYVPMLFKQMWGSYDSALYIQNTDTANSANVTIKFYDREGTLNCTKTDSIPKLSSHGYWLPSESCLPAKWYGGVVVTADRDIVAVGRPHIGDQVMTYNGFASGSLSMYVPMLFKQMWGYDSAFYVQNTDDTNDANITIDFYDPDGNLSCTKSDTILPLSSRGYWLPSESCLPANWYGGVVVTSDKNIVAVGRPHLGSEVTTYNGFAGGSLTMYAPTLFKHFNSTYDSALYIQNVDPSNTANITIKFYDPSGVLSCTKTDSIPPRSSKGYWLPSEACLPSSWQGSVKVESDYPVVGIARPHLGSSITAYDGFTGGGTVSSVPMLFKQMWGSYDSALYMENINETTAANVTVKFYDVNGNLSCVKADTIPALGVLSYWLPSLTCSP
jgi:glucose/arabinose dehydrogenase